MNIVITGASRGIGYYTALHLSRLNGNKIFALSRDENGLKKLVATAENGERIISIPCDISKEESVKNALKMITEKVSGVDVLINNAGFLINKTFDELTLDDWMNVYRVNVFGVVSITQALLPMLKKGMIDTEHNIKSHVVNISSIGGIQGSQKFNGLSVYSSSKGSLITLSECLAEELKSSGVRVNALALGSVETEMFNAAFPGMQASSDPKEMADFIAEFATKGHRFFNGKIIPVSTSNP